MALYGRMGRGRDTGRRREPRRGGGRYGSGRSRRDRDDYEDEEPAYYAEPARDTTARHEQTALYIFLGVGVFILIVVIITFAAGGGEPSSGFTNPMAGSIEYFKPEREMEKVDAREQASMAAYHKALQYYRQNEYEDKEDLMGPFQDVISQYPGTRGAEEAAKMLKEIQDRQR
ncbi:MAG: hypothetical protein N2234_00930 [Planctomycetota bacterium]|nr:hypothetical protein [Planctomycetota bacterium]